MTYILIYIYIYRGQVSEHIQGISVLTEEREKIKQQNAEQVAIINIQTDEVSISRRVVKGQPITHFYMSMSSHI
jgi:hypothetical protein